MVSQVSGPSALVRDRSPQKPADAPAGVGTHILAAALVLASVLFLAWVRVSTLHLGYEMGRLRAEQDKLLQENRALQVELGTLRSQAQLMGLARKLNMVPPQAASVVERAGGGAP
jgi:cell division protein FtsL